jgi:hypothetical protein
VGEGDQGREHQSRVTARDSGLVSLNSKEQAMATTDANRIKGVLTPVITPFDRQL